MSDLDLRSRLIKSGHIVPAACQIWYDRIEQVFFQAPDGPTIWPWVADPPTLRIVSDVFDWLRRLPLLGVKYHDR